MNDRIDVQAGRPRVLEAGEVLALMNPLSHPFDACAGVPYKTCHRVTIADQGAAQSPADETARTGYQDATHIHFQPKRLKNLNADIENIRI